jgi:amidase
LFNLPERQLYSTDLASIGFQSLALDRSRPVLSTGGISGLPQVTIPIGTVTGCPVGLSFIGWPGADEALLDVAVAVSRYCGVVG